MALVQSDFDTIQGLITSELNAMFSLFIGDYQTNGYPIVPSDGFSRFDMLLSDYQTNGYPIVPSDGFSRFDMLLSDYQTNGYPTSSGGSAVDLSPIQTVVDQIALNTGTLLNDSSVIKGYTDTVETSLTAIKAKTDTITALNLAPVQSVVDSIKLKTDTITPMDLAPLTTTVNLINGKVTTVQNSLDANLDSKVSTIYPQISALLSDPTALNGFDYFDLNGNFGSFSNGTDVYLYPTNYPYKVEKSYLFQNDTNQFLIMYILVDALGKKMVAPHSYLSSIAPVVVGDVDLEAKIVLAQSTLLAHINDPFVTPLIGTNGHESYEQWNQVKIFYESVLADLISQRV